MQTIGKFIGKRGVNQALPRHPPEAGKPGADDPHAKMGFPIRPGASVAGMGRRLILNVEGQWREGRAELGLNTRLPTGHVVTFTPVRPPKSNPTLRNSLTKPA